MNVAQTTHGVFVCGSAGLPRSVVMVRLPGQRIDCPCATLAMYASHASTQYFILSVGTQTSVEERESFSKVDYTKILI